MVYGWQAILNKSSKITLEDFNEKGIARGSMGKKKELTGMT